MYYLKLTQTIFVTHTLAPYSPVLQKVKMIETASTNKWFLKKNEPWLYAEFLRKHILARKLKEKNIVVQDFFLKQNDGVFWKNYFVTSR